MNFIPFFTTAIESLYRGPKTQLFINGILSSDFNISRGTRQGCLLSPILFALVIEPLACAIRNDSNVKGIPIGDNPFKTSLFADTVLYVTEPHSSLPAMSTIIQNFKEISGLSINASKSILYPILMSSDLSLWIKQHFSFKWVSSNWKYLGLQIALNLHHLFKANFSFLDSFFHSSIQDNGKPMS